MAGKLQEETVLRIKCAFSLFWVEVGSLTMLECHLFYASPPHKYQSEEDLKLPNKAWDKFGL